jgi:glycosyltransferase involved in cell wall biosynthesis
MKILFATDQYLPTPGGISIVIERLANALEERGHQVCIMAPSTSWKFKREKKNGIIVFRIPSVLIHKAKQLRYSPKFLHKKNIIKVIDSFGPDIIHIETSDSIVATTVEIARKRNIPLIATCHIMPQNISGSLPFLPSKIGKMMGNMYMKQMIQVFLHRQV